LGRPAVVSGVSDLTGMKFKDILIIIFLAGLLIYAACHRAGFVGKANADTAISENYSYEANGIDSVKFENWIFSSHPESGLTVTTTSGDVIHHLPDFSSGHIEIVTEPDSSGYSLGLVYVRSDCGMENPCFRISTEGELEKTSI
jgi:hypothetical protein